MRNPRCLSAALRCGVAFSHSSGLAAFRRRLLYVGIPKSRLGCYALAREPARPVLWTLVQRASAAGESIWRCARAPRPGRQRSRERLSRAREEDRDQHDAVSACRTVDRDRGAQILRYLVAGDAGCGRARSGRHGLEPAESGAAAGPEPGGRPCASRAAYRVAEAESLLS